MVTRRDFMTGAGGAMAGALLPAEPVMVSYPGTPQSSGAFARITPYVCAYNAPKGILQAAKRIREMMRPKWVSLYGDYIRVCDGTADHVDLQAAWDLNVGKVEMGPGDFAHTVQVDLDQGGGELIGSGKEHTIITFRTTTVADTQAALKIDSVNGVKIVDLSLHASAVGSGSQVFKAFIYGNKANRCRILNVHTEGNANGAGSKPEYHILIEGVDGVAGSYNWKLDQLYMQAGQRHIGIRSVDANGAEVDETGFKCGMHTLCDCVSTGATVASERLVATREIVHYGCDFESAVTGFEFVNMTGFGWFGGWNGGHSSAGLSITGTVARCWVISPYGQFQNYGLLEGLAGGVTLVGVNMGIMGAGLRRGSGSSTGTGAQQTVAHGLPYTPTRQQIALFQGSASANPYHSAAPDATNIYVTAANLQPWYWAVVG